MKYYVIEIVTGDSKVAGKSIYEYNSHIEALSSFHKKLGTAMGSELYTSDLIMLVSEDGNLSAIEKFVREVETVEVE